MQIHWRNAHEIGEEQRVTATDKLASLAETHRDLIDLWVDVEPQSEHHRLGRRRVEVRCQARGAELVVHGEADDVGLALRDALRAFERKVKRLRGRRRDSRSEAPAAAPLRGVVDRVVRSEGYGFLLTDDGERVYFHRNAVGGGLDFDALDEGAAVALNYEAGADGLQATFVKPVEPA